MKPALRMLLLDSQATLQSYLAGLGALVYFDGTLNGSNIANKGSLGASVNGVPTAITINANGMNFDGDTSKITVPLVAGISALTNQEIVIIGNATAGGGEGGVGTFFRFGLNPMRLVFTTGGTVILGAVDYNTTDATTQISAPGAGLRAYFMTHDATTTQTRIRLGSGGTVSNPTQTPVTGGATIVAPSSDLVIGNVSINTAGFAGSMLYFLYFGRVLTDAERLGIAGFLA